MRAEGPKERPTAVLCVQLSARYVQIRQTAKKFEILRPSGYDITFLIFFFLFFYIIIIMKGTKVLTLGAGR